MTYTKDFSVIVPTWRGAIKYLPKLFDSIPDEERIEIIVVDNSLEPVSRTEIDSNREFILLHSDYNRHAGGGRNDGIIAANGKWLLFADSDDFYTNDAFETYYSMINSDAEIVYTGMGGVYEDTGEPSDRGDKYKRMVHQYCVGEMEELDLRISFSSPCCKMVSHELVNRHCLKYDEIRASNDLFFSLTSGYYAKKIAALDKVTYIATVNRGSLTRRRDYEVIKARLYAKLKCNQFLREHGLADRQRSVMFAIAESRRFGLSKTLEFCNMIAQFHQNPFVGWRRWFNTIFIMKDKQNKEAKYIVK